MARISVAPSDSGVRGIFSCGVFLWVPSGHGGRGFSWGRVVVVLGGDGVGGSGVGGTVSQSGAGWLYYCNW